MDKAIPLLISTLGIGSIPQEHPYVEILTRTLWTTTLNQEYLSWQEHETLPLFLTCLHELVDLEPDTRNHVASLVSHSNLYIPAAYGMDGSSTDPYLDLLCQTPSTMGGVPLQTPYSTQEGRKARSGPVGNSLSLRIRIRIRRPCSDNTLARKTFSVQPTIRSYKESHC